MKKQQGFTLIELIVVIVILGILAVTAAPKFIDVQSDAKVATLQGLAGAISGANSMIYGKAVLNGTETLVGTDAKAKVVVGNVNVKTDYGYIAADADDIIAALNINEAEWVWSPVSDNTGSIATGGSVTIWPKGQAATSDCKITYTPAANKTTPATVSVVATASDC